MVHSEKHTGESWPERTAAGGGPACEYCGEAIYSLRHTLRVSANGRLIHEDCWLDYSADNISLFTSRIDE